MRSLFLSATVRSLFLSATVLTFVVQSGCLSLTAAETGQTVGRGELDVTFSAASGSYSEASISGPQDAYHDGDELPGDLIPVVELGVTFGVGETTDIGLRANSALFASARLKQQVIGTKSSPFATSFGVEAGANAGVALFGYAYGYAAVPLYVSLHPSESVALYVVPRYAVVTVVPFAPPPDAGRTETSSWRFPSLSYGVVLGKRYRFVAEVGHTRQEALCPSQVSLGTRIRLN